MKGALKLVGDKFALTERQRLGVSRAACFDQSKAQRAAARVPMDSLKGEPVIIDGFNRMLGFLFRIEVEMLTGKRRTRQIALPITH